MPTGGFKRPMTRGSIEALAYVMNFSVGVNYGAGVSLASESWRNIGDHETPRVDDLVSVTMAEPSVWCIGWLVDYDPGLTGRYGRRFRVENLIDRRIAWWANIGLRVFDKAREFPQWRWNDHQFAFDRRWRRALFPYTVRSRRTVFDGNAVTVSAGQYWSNGRADDIIESASFDDFRKLKLADLRDTAGKLEARIQTRAEARKGAPSGVRCNN